MSPYLPLVTPLQCKARWARVLPLEALSSAQGSQVVSLQPGPSVLPRTTPRCPLLSLCLGATGLSKLLSRRLEGPRTPTSPGRPPPQALGSGKAPPGPRDFNTLHTEGPKTLPH